jgi:hypothetical protein
VLESESIMKKFFLCILILSVFCGGCSWFSSKKASRRVNPDDLVVKLDEKKKIDVNDALENGTVMDHDQLKHGGNVIVIPFSPGSNIEANDEFDKVTLRIIRGIADEFESEKSPFTFISSDGDGQADFLIEGRVIELQKPTMMKTMTLQHNRYRLAVQGKLINRDTEKPVLVFTDTAESKSKKETLEILGTKIGHHIGRYITSGGSAK